MTVYELIQELAQYDPDLIVKVFVNGKIDTYVNIPDEEEIDEDREMLLPVDVDELCADYSVNYIRETNRNKPYIELEVNP